MEQNEIANALQGKVKLSSSDLNLFFRLAQLKTYFKNEHLVKTGDYDVVFYLIKSGCLMTYFKDRQDQIHAIQFGQEMWWTGDLDAFFNQKASKYGIKALTEVEVYMLSKENFEKINKMSAAFETYFRQLFQNALISHQNRIIRNISYTAEEKYLEFVKIHPKLELIVPQKYIASYMGITPEFLSKLKRKLAEA